MAAKKAQTAAEYMADLQSDPEYVERVRQREEARELEVSKNQVDAAPVFAALADVGFEVSSFAELRRIEHYRAAIPVLLDWLPQVTREDVREDIVRSLTVPYAREAVGPLLALFTSTANESFRWAVGNGLGVLAADDIAPELFALVRERRWGKARQMIVLGLTGLRTEQTGQVLLDLLGDPDVEGQALEALAKRKAKVPRELVEPFLTHKQAWIRRCARKLLRA